ncbi:phosphonate ABC transporter ATP-binding protein [Accumulibacter sp.]|uniref:phosphonate ABC transporter ATP-binding protein n=1 Tax=Accumulibacter sp. TaxID=2053492 RepID=UPI0035B048B1
MNAAVDAASGMRGAPLVELRGVRCTAGGRTLLAVDSLAITAGERVAIVGHNGAGKSTLLKLVSGFVTPGQGIVTVLGQRLPQPSAAALRALRRDVGQVMQGLHLVARLSALENVLVGCLGRVDGWRSWTRFFPADEVAAARQALHAVGIGDRCATRADRLSGGERQKVAIARLLLQRPRLILADEPTAALDPAAAGEVCALLANAAGADAGVTLLSVVHSPALLPLLCERVIGLAKGRIVFDLPLAAVGDGALASLYRPPTRPLPLPGPGTTAAVPAGVAAGVASGS